MQKFLGSVSGISREEKRFQRTAEAPEIRQYRATNTKGLIQFKAALSVMIPAVAISKDLFSDEKPLICEYHHGGPVPDAFAM